MPTTLQTRIELFGPRPGDGKQFDASQTTYAYPTAVTAGQWGLRPSLVTADVADVTARVVWTPNASGCGLKLEQNDGVNGGVPINPVNLAEFTGYTNTTPVSHIQSITTLFQAALDTGASAKYFSWLFKGNGSVGPMVYSVWLDIVWSW